MTMWDLPEKSMISITFNDQCNSVQHIVNSNNLEDSIWLILVIIIIITTNTNNSEKTRSSLTQ